MKRKCRGFTLNLVNECLLHVYAICIGIQFAGWLQILSHLYILYRTITRNIIFQVTNINNRYVTSGNYILANFPRELCSGVTHGHWKFSIYLYTFLFPFIIAQLQLNWEENSFLFYLLWSARNFGEIFPNRTEFLDQ